MTQRRSFLFRLKLLSLIWAKKGDYHKSCDLPRVLLRSKLAIFMMFAILAHGLHHCSS